MIVLFFACEPTTTKIVTEPSEEGLVLSDEDGDGYYGDEDCDDSDASIEFALDKRVCDTV